jgi:hypothetical protein
MADVQTIKQSVIRAVQALGADVSKVTQATTVQQVSAASSAARSHGDTARAGLRELEAHERKPNNTSKDKLLIRTTRNKLSKDLARLETLLAKATAEAQERVAAMSNDASSSNGASSSGNASLSKSKVAWSSGRHHETEKGRMPQVSGSQQQQQQQVCKSF